MVFLLKLDSNYEWIIHSEIVTPNIIEFGLFGTSMELSQDGKVICIANKKTDNLNNSVFIYDEEGNLRQEITGLIESSFGNTLVISKNKKQLLISSHEYSEASDIAFSGKIEVFNLINNLYELFQKLTINVPYDHFGEIIFTNYDIDSSFNKLNMISTMGYHTRLTVYVLHKNKWCLKY